MENNGTIAGGTYEREVYNHASARITGGTFNNLLTNEGVVRGEGGSVPTINQVIAQPGTGSGGIYQPCNFGESASVAEGWQGVIEVVMEVNGTSQVVHYGANILQSLKGYGSETAVWKRVNADGSLADIGDGEIFGLQLQRYRQPIAYHVTKLDTLEGVDLSAYTDIVVEESGELATGLSVSLYVTNYGRISSGTFTGLVINNAQHYRRRLYRCIQHSQ